MAQPHFNDGEVLYAADLNNLIDYADDTRDTAEQARDDAQTAKASAETAQFNAEAARDSAQAAQSAAETAESNAGSARSAAESAQFASESARDDAQSAKGDAETARSDAQAARDDAQAAKTDAEQARDDALQAVQEAETIGDEGVTALIEDTNSDTRSALDSLYSGPGVDFPSESGVLEYDSSTEELSAITATAQSTGNTLVLRDGVGRFRAANPVNNNQVATKQYVDNTVENVWDDLSGGTYDVYSGFNDNLEGVISYRSRGPFSLVSGTLEGDMPSSRTVKILNWHSEHRPVEDTSYVARGRNNELRIVTFTTGGQVVVEAPSNIDNTGKDVILDGILIFTGNFQ